MYYVTVPCYIYLPILETITASIDSEVPFVSITVEKLKVCCFSSMVVKNSAVMLSLVYYSHFYYYLALPVIIAQCTNFSLM